MCSDASSIIYQDEWLQIDGLTFIIMTGVHWQDQSIKV